MDLLGPTTPTPLQELSGKFTEEAGIRLFIKRDDLIHPTVSGNKWRKLKYSLVKAKAENKSTLLTFGGAYSNHLYATAAAGNALGFRTIGIVRGEELAEKETPTLKFCREQHMQLHFVSRQEYRQKHSEEYLLQLSGQFDFPFIIPEGGTSGLALKGVAEMVTEVRSQLASAPDFFAVAAGTGGTAAGILYANANVLAFSALKGGGFLENEIQALLAGYENMGKLKLFTDYHFGGYAKWNPELLDFIESFKNNHGIQLEQVYTGKMFFGLFELIRSGYFAKGTVIVAVHTGGLQGLRIK
ncbi:1-aminocyclopropane-1-carboxylate deaminase/D-cysteine desulfhydrase [Dyadobacter sediminis]|uniref:1-aminocyclopropane-1-carboxylate deaminase/D-cysteine desulfhydrase n=1 Tax=Dyadobacter sediminis TaxID=1493691 RepID=A0A5R9KF22_9BACT|nr:pyridoxal-phosphate dependent enzyme [Dyadobacter sediminis]TLU94641.1 1-aminocyclopropane-1-carboxylate deaminase/D-cysteine desulfhydrase [Dyadobacter sediminis]GGB89487.1 1-aminocyclopropane-1-carboxylate deaminase [Dyadobacter sediminis]